MSGHPDAPVVLPEAEVHPGLHHHPYLGAEEILHAERWWDADRDAVRPVCPGRVGASPEVRQDLKAAAAEKSAVREPRLAGAVRALPAWGVPWAILD